MVELLYEAAGAACRSTSSSRGICCLRRACPGCRENIRVRSILGRYLEHSRIFRFGNGEGAERGAVPDRHRRPDAAQPRPPRRGPDARWPTPSTRHGSTRCSSSTSPTTSCVGSCNPTTGGTGRERPHRRLRAPRSGAALPLRPSSGRSAQARQVNAFATSPPAAGSSSLVHVPAGVRTPPIPTVRLGVTRTPTRTGSSAQGVQQREHPLQTPPSGRGDTRRSVSDRRLRRRRRRRRRRYHDRRGRHHGGCRHDRRCAGDDGGQ